MAGSEGWMVLAAGSGAGGLWMLLWHCHCAAIGAETGLGLAYLMQSEFIILNNEAVSGFFAQKFRSVHRLRRFTAPSCGMIGRIRYASPVMGWRVPGLRRACHHQRHDRGRAGGQQGLGGFVQCVAAGHHVIHQGQVLAGHALGVRHAEGAAQVLLALGAGQAGLAGGVAHAQQPVGADGWAGAGGVGAHAAGQLQALVEAAFGQAWAGQWNRHQRIHLLQRLGGIGQQVLHQQHAQGASQLQLLAEFQGDQRPVQRRQIIGQREGGGQRQRVLLALGARQGGAG